jgi:hypothetical protein
MNMPAAALHGEEAAAGHATYIHATALAVAETGILIRGPSGAGKSRLALQLIAEAGRRGLFARLVGDDRIAVAARGGRLIARPHPTIAGQIESRGEGILATPHEAAAVLRLVIDVGAKPAAAKPVAKHMPRSPFAASNCRSSPWTVRDHLRLASSWIICCGWETAEPIRNSKLLSYLPSSLRCTNVLRQNDEPVPGRSCTRRASGGTAGAHGVAG